MSELRSVFSAQLEPFFAALSNSSSWWHNWGHYAAQIATLNILQSLPSQIQCTVAKLNQWAAVLAVHFGDGLQCKVKHWNPLSTVLQWTATQFSVKCGDCAIQAIAHWELVMKCDCHSQGRCRPFDWSLWLACLPPLTQRLGKPLARIPDGSLLSNCPCPLLLLCQCAC